MDRRRALVVAGTLTATVAMAGGAMAVNLGLLGADRDPVGDLNPTAIQPTAAEQPHRTTRQRPRVRVIVQDIPVAAGGGTAGSSGSGYSGTAAAGSTAPGGVVAATPAPAPLPTPVTPTPVVDDDHGGDDDVFEDDGGEDHGDEIDGEDHGEVDDD